MVPLHSCVLSMMLLQQQSRLNLLCRGSAWKHRWALDTSAWIPRAPGIYQRTAEVDSISQDMFVTSPSLSLRCLATIATVTDCSLHGDPRKMISLAEGNARTQRGVIPKSCGNAVPAQMFKCRVWGHKDSEEQRQKDKVAGEGKQFQGSCVCAIDATV